MSRGSSWTDRRSLFNIIGASAFNLDLLLGASLGFATVSMDVHDFLHHDTQRQLALQLALLIDMFP